MRERSKKKAVRNEREIKEEAERRLALLDDQTNKGKILKVVIKEMN